MGCDRLYTVFSKVKHHMINPNSGDIQSKLFAGSFGTICAVLAEKASERLASVSDSTPSPRDYQLHPSAVSSLLSAEGHTATFLRASATDDPFRNLPIFSRSSRITRVFSSAINVLLAMRQLSGIYGHTHNCACNTCKLHVLGKTGLHANSLCFETSQYSQHGVSSNQLCRPV